MLLTHLGRYLLLVRASFHRPAKFRLYFKESIREMSNIGMGSLGIIALVSAFIGAVTAVQTASQMTSGLVPMYMIGMFTRNAAIMELSPAVCSLVLAGNIGSSIASQIGTMRVTEQIDALEIMGVNTPSYLIFPKIIGAVFAVPMLITIAIVFNISGGLVFSSLTGVVSYDEFVIGLTSQFDTSLITLFLMKSVTFAFLITTISAYQGFYTTGGAREVGISSTKAVVYSCVMIVIFDYVIAQSFF